MPEQLARGYLSLLIAIQENPFGTIDELAKRSGTSKPTTVRRIRELQAQRLFVVKPLLNNRNLGFDFFDVFLETSSIDGVKRIESIGEKHPYTSYNGRCFGAINGVLLQFRTPSGTKPLIEDLAQYLVDDGTALSYRFVPVEDGHTTYTDLSLKGWDQVNLSWKFDWEDWFNKDVKLIDFPKETSEVGSALEWFDDKDAQILFEVMHGERRKNLEILKALKDRGINITPQTFSRRYQMLKEQCFSGHRVTFDPSVFDIYNNLVIVGRGSSDRIQELQSKLHTRPIPFQSSMRASGPNFLWSIRLQSSHLSALLSNLYSYLDWLEVSIIDYAHSHLYFVWPGNYDSEKHEWRRDREFMIDDVLK